MPIARFQMPDGRVARFEVPEGTTPEQAQSLISGFVQQQAQSAPPAEDMGRAEALLVSAGRGTDQLVKGAQQLYFGLKSKFEPQTLSSLVSGEKPSQTALRKLAEQQAEETRLYQPLKDKYPVVTSIGEAAPMMAVPLGGGGALATIGKSAVAGAIPGLVGYGSMEERLKRGGVGAAGGAAGGAAAVGLSKLLKPAGVGAVGASDDALQAAQRVGFTPSPGNVSQNPAMLNFENYLARNPGSSGRMQAFNEANQTALNRAAAKSMGENADTLSEGVVSAAKDRIGSEFNRLGKATTADLSQPKFMQALIDVDTANLARGPYANKAVTQEVERALELAAQGKLSGVAYKEIRTEIASQANKAFKNGDSTLGQSLKTIRDSLDDAAKAGLSKADQKAWDVARQQWQAWKTLTKGNVAEAGNVSAAKVASEVRRMGPGLRTGAARGELADIARVGEAFKSVTNPNSGNLMQQMVYGNPITGLPMVAANKLASAAYMNPMGQRYFGSGLLNVGPTGLRELSRASGLLGVPATQTWLGVE